MGVCCCLQTYNSFLYVVVMGLALGQSLMVISTTGIMCYARVSPLYNVSYKTLLENEKFFDLKRRGYRDGIKRKETR